MNSILLALTEPIQAGTPPVIPPPVTPPIHFISVIGLLYLICLFVLFILIIIALVKFIKFLGSSRKEQQLMRFELGKLAEEVHKIRQELKPEKKQ